VDKEQIRAELTREPFVSLRLHLWNGKTFDVPFREVAHMLGYGVLALKGLKQGTHQAKVTIGLCSTKLFVLSSALRERRDGVGIRPLECNAR